MAAATEEAYGRVDILVHNAATNPHFGPLLNAEDSMWQKTLEVNLLGAFWLTQAVVPMMEASGGGKIITVASINGVRPGRGQGIYSATKAALINLTQTLALELGPMNIQVNALAPGLVQTAFARALWQNEELRAGVEARTPLGRIGQPQDLTGIALYLASSRVRFHDGAGLCRGWRCHAADDLIGWRLLARTSAFMKGVREANLLAHRCHHLHALHSQAGQSRALRCERPRG